MPSKKRRAAEMEAPPPLIALSSVKRELFDARTALWVQQGLTLAALNAAPERDELWDDKRFAGMKRSVARWAGADGQVHYAVSKPCAGTSSGRVYAAGGAGLQAFQRVAEHEQ